MDIVTAVAAVVALVAHGMALLARAEVRRLQRLLDARRSRTVVVNITADASQFQAAMARAAATTRRLA